MQVGSIFNEYIVGKQAVALLPEYDEYGNLGTLVKESGTDDFIHIRKKSYDIINDSLLHYGKGDLQGVMKASKVMLGNKDMPPIMMSRKLGIYWIPLSSPTAPDNVWLAFNHVYQTHRLSSKNTLITFYDQDQIEVQKSKRTIDEKIGDAGRLKTLYEAFYGGNLILTNKNFHIVKEHKGPTYSYIIRKKKE